LVKRATTELAADVDAKAAFLPVAAAPRNSRPRTAGTKGMGPCSRWGRADLVRQPLDEAPYGFAECRRGHLGTKPAAHKKGDRVAHLVRSYGYHMFDMDTSLLDEVASHFAGWPTLAEST